MIGVDMTPDMLSAARAQATGFACQSCRMRVSVFESQSFLNFLLREPRMNVIKISTKNDGFDGQINILRYPLESTNIF